MRIVLVGTAYPMRGGIAHYVALLYRKLTERGHEVYVLSFKRQYPSFLFPGKTQEDEGQELIPMDSVPILDSIGPWSWFKAFLWLKKLKPDLLIFKYWLPFFAPCYAAVALLAKTIGIKSIYLCDNIIPHEPKRIEPLLTRIGLKYIDAFIVQSRSVQNDLLKFRPEARFRFVPHPVYEIFPPALSKEASRKKLGIAEEHVITYFGFIRPYKGVRILVDAMAQIPENLNVRLLICGEFYEGREDILSRIEASPAKDRITVYDQFIPNEDVPLYFSAAEVIVLPYLSATQSGIVQIAYHYEKPVIVTRVGGLPEVVPDGKAGFVVEPDDPKALAEAITAFYIQKKEEPFTQGVREEKKKYSWDRMTEAVEAFGKELNILNHTGKE